VNLGGVCVCMCACVRVVCVCACVHVCMCDARQLSMLLFERTSVCVCTTDFSSMVVHISVLSGILLCLTHSPQYISLCFKEEFCSNRHCRLVQYLCSTSATDSFTCLCVQLLLYVQNVCWGDVTHQNAT